MARTARSRVARTVAYACIGIVVVLAVTVLTALQATVAAPGPLRAVSARVWAVRYEAFPVSDDAELASLHAAVGRGSTARCIACHGDKSDSRLPVHQIHLRSAVLSMIACPDCHPTVELGPRTQSRTTRWVDVGFCKNCHSAFPGMQPESHMADQDLHAECLSCHTGDLAVRHEQPYLPDTVPASECGGCHGGRALPWTEGHERDDWLTAHGPEALDEGSEPCFACHDFGLKFCDECHAQTPQSHLPSELWRDAHPAAAREDVRVCDTCHDASDCKRCHLSHEDGWIVSHPTYISENGDASCDECHSRAACTRCHTGSAIGPLTQP